MADVQVPAIAAHKPVAWLGMFLTLGAPMLIAIEPAMPALIATRFPPASVAILVAAFGGLVTAASAEAQKRGIAVAVPRGVVPPALLVAEAAGALPKPPAE